MLSAITFKLLDIYEDSCILSELCGVNYRAENYFYGHCIEAGSPSYQICEQVLFEQNGETLREIRGLKIYRYPMLSSSGKIKTYCNQCRKTLTR